MGSFARGLAVVAALGAAAPAASPQLPKDVTTADVCAAVPGAQIARAVGGVLAEAKLVRPGGTHARCRYTVVLPPGKGPADAVLVLWLHAAGEFDDLRKYQEGPVQPADGLGDAAFIAVDKDSGRHDLFVLLRGVATLEVTGPTAASVRAAAAAAVSSLRPPAKGR